MNKITILIVDDHTLIRETWSFILDSDPLFRVVAECGSAEEAIEQARILRPQIVTMDINLPGMNGVEATQQIRKYSPGSKILGVSLYTQPAYASKMIQQGAMGYITKNSSREEIFDALKEIHAGRKYICKEIRNTISEQEINGNNEQRNRINELSLRELEVISFIKKGYSSKEIANALSLSVKTVEVHRHNILKKLNLTNASALVNFMNQNYIGLN
jgi:DNA-binding NarL/FixJ family response regulator